MMKDGMIRYPNSECEEHRDVKTSAPVCIICMAQEAERLREDVDKATDEIERLKIIEKASSAFFSWFNKNYPLAPSNHHEHPWCALGSLLFPNS